jgi:uncharacterized protein
MNASGRMKALLAGLLAGIAGGLFGVGGGIVLIPLLTGWFKTTQHQAHGTSLAAIGATAVTSIIVYGTHSHVAWGTALAVGLASAFAARFGARAAARTSPRGLTTIFAIFLVVVAIRLLWKAPEPAAHPVATGAGGIAIGIALGIAIGLFSGFMGVGGGILAVPGFTLLMGMPQQLAQGTSLAVILLTAPAGAVEHARHGNLVWSVVPLLAIGASVGGALSSWWVQGLPHLLLVRCFAVFLLVNAGLIGLRAWRAAAKAAAASPRPIRT